MTKRQPQAQPPEPPKPLADGLATPERAAEIARMKKFGLQEFIELTSVGMGPYGIYRISRKGVTVRDTDDEDQQLAPKDQVHALKAEAKLELVFPCEPLEFQEWYEATRGTDNSSSDFPLASGFLRALAAAEGASLAYRGPTIPSSKIIAAFKVKTSPRENQKWWNDRMRSAKKYGLLTARVSPGRAKQQSLWRPDMVAAWLVDRGHIKPADVRRTAEQHFPEIDINLL